MADRVGQQLGNYQLIRLLGEGGFAQVYLGEHIHLGTPSAIKVLHTQLTEEDVGNFRTEARTIARLIHPHIVRVLEFGVEDKTPFLVLDYAPNGTLRQRHAKGVPLSLSTIVPYVKQIADALHYAHEEKLIHRDIKPENMLVGRRNEILLSDFGIAIVAQSSRYQNTQDMAGTIAYMAPEQIQAHPRPASDQYSLGIVVYEWLTGERPFNGSFTEVAAKHSVAPPPPLREKIPSIAPDVEQVVMTALAKEPKQRFLTIQAFANALEQASQSLPSSTLAPTIISRPNETAYPTLPLAPTVRSDPPQKTKEQWLKEGNTLRGHKRYQEALAVYEQALHLDPNYALAYNGRGNALKALRRYQEALASFEQALRLNPNYALAYNGKGAVFYELQRYPEALAAFEQALRLDPNDALAYYNKGATLYELKRYSEALVAYEQALRLNPNYVLAYNGKGNALKALRRYSEALASFEQALRLDPNYALAYNGKGALLHELKRYQEALVAYEQALRLDPNYALGYYNKALVLERLGRTREAQQARIQAIQLGYG